MTAEKYSVYMIFILRQGFISNILLRHCGILELVPSKEGLVTFFLFFSVEYPGYSFPSEWSPGAISSKNT